MAQYINKSVKYAIFDCLYLSKFSDIPYNAARGGSHMDKHLNYVQKNYQQGKTFHFFHDKVNQFIWEICHICQFIASQF